MRKTVATLTITILAATIAHAGLNEYLDTIGTPVDGGDGPALWYKTARSPNEGSAAVSYAMDYTGLMTNMVADYWGNADSAFGISDKNEGLFNRQGALVVDSYGLFASGTNGTVTFLFKMDESFEGFKSFFNQGYWGDDSQLGVGINNGKLRIGTYNGNLEGDDVYQYDNIGDLATNTWYYFGMTWDISVSTNNLTWHFGVAGATSLNSGQVTITSAGSSDKRIYFAGRTSTYYYTAFNTHFQSIAIYERTLSDAAMRTQFNAFSNLPSGYAGFLEIYEITGPPNSAPEEDYDADGQLNIYEYGLGGNPTNAADVGTEPVFSMGADNNASFRNVILTDLGADITYFVEQTDDLAIGAWTNSGWNLVSTNATGDAAFDEVLHRISGDQENLFIRLRITQP